MLNSAVLQKLTVIGEAATRLPKKFIARFLEISKFCFYSTNLIYLPRSDQLAPYSVSSVTPLI